MPESPVYYTRGNAEDAYPRALTPLSEDLVVGFEELGIRDFYFRRLGALRDGDCPRPLMSAIDGYLYLDVENMGVLGDRMPGTNRRDIYRQLFGLKVDPNYRDAPMGTLAELRAAARVVPRLLRLTRGLVGEIAGLEREIAATRPPAGSPDLPAWMDRLDALQIRCWSCLPVGSAIASAFYGAFVKSLAKKVGEEHAPELANALHIGLGGNQTADVGVYVRAAAERLRHDPDLDLEHDPSFRLALERFGYRAAAELELANPSWRQDPTPLIQAVRREARRPAAASDGRETRAAAEREFEAVAGRGLRLALARSRKQMPLRENSKLPICRLFDEYRRLLAAAVPQLVERGVLTEARQVHMLRHAELQQVLRGGDGPGAAVLGDRAAEHARCLELELPDLVQSGPDGVRAVGPEFYTERGLIPVAAAQAGATELSGTGASPGVVTGTARVLRDPDEDFEPGDILFAHSVDPGWTPLLVCAGAIVLDTGGEMSHGATVARELGVPCVVNVKHGMAVVPDGGRVEVDGGSGTVRVLAGVPA